MKEESLAALKQKAFPFCKEKTIREEGRINATG